MATATTTTPDRPPKIKADGIKLPCVSRENGNVIYVEVRQVENVAAVKLIYPVLNEREDGQGMVRKVEFDHYGKIEREGDYFAIPMNYAPDLRAINPGPPREGCAELDDFAEPQASVMVAAGGPGWPEWLNASLNEIARPNSFSNVEGGHGYVGGIYSDTLEVPIYLPIAR